MLCLVKHCKLLYSDCLYSAVCLYCVKSYKDYILRDFIYDNELLKVVCVHIHSYMNMIVLHTQLDARFRKAEEALLKAGTHILNVGPVLS